MSTAHFPPEIAGPPAFEGPFDAFQLDADGCNVLFATYPAGTSITPHRHDTNNVGVITEGRLVLTMNGEQQTFGVGEWYHVPAGAEHAADFPNDAAEIEFWFRTSPTVD